MSLHTASPWPGAPPAWLLPSPPGVPGHCWRLSPAHGAGGTKFPPGTPLLHVLYRDSYVGRLRVSPTFTQHLYTGDPKVLEFCMKVDLSEAGKEVSPPCKLPSGREIPADEGVNAHAWAQHPDPDLKCPFASRNLHSPQPTASRGRPPEEMGRAS